MMELRRCTVHSIQLLRAAAATLVTFYHAHTYFFGSNSKEIIPNESYIFGIGAVGVHIFFVISGFIMVMTSHSSQYYRFIEFISRRARRIYPIYWISMLICLFVFAIFAKMLPLTLSELLGAAILLPGQAGNVIGAAWTLSYEIYFYLCFGLAMCLGLNRGLLVLAAYFLASIAIGVIIPDKGPILAQATNSLLLEFLGGTMIGWLAVRDRLPQRLGPLLTAFALAYFLTGWIEGYDRVPHVISWGIPSVLLVLGLVSWESMAGAHRVVKAAGPLGDSSYALYLNHEAIILVVAAICSFARHWQAIPIAIMATVICIIFGEVVHRGIENPVLQRLQAKPNYRTASTE